MEARSAARALRAPSRVLFICGSTNQTKQMHAVASAMHEIDARFSPFFGGAVVTAMRRLNLIENTIGGNKLRHRCLSYLHQHGLSVDLDPDPIGYELIVACTDLALSAAIGASPLVIVQEGILDPPGLAWELVRRFPRLLPRWLAGTTGTGSAGKYRHFCVASEGYRDLFIARGAPADRLVVTGIPNFDDCATFLDNDFPHRGYVLACSSDARETFKRHDRRAFIRNALRVANGRELFFKLHPNENVRRARRELERWAPNALLFVDGPTDAMVANCSALITEWSSVAFVGLALGKEVHSSHPMSELKRLLPEQNRSAAQRIAAVCEAELSLNSMGWQARPRVAA